MLEPTAQLLVSTALICNHVRKLKITDRADVARYKLNYKDNYVHRNLIMLYVKSQTKDQRGAGESTL